MSKNDTSLCHLSPDSIVRCVELISDLYTAAVEHLPPLLLTFFVQQDAKLTDLDKKYTPIGGSIAVQIILASLKRSVNSKNMGEQVRSECYRVLSNITDILINGSQEGEIRHLINVTF